MKRINQLLALSILSITLTNQAKEVTIGVPGKPGSMTFNVPETKQDILNQLVLYANAFATDLLKVQKSGVQLSSDLEKEIKNLNIDTKQKEKLLIKLTALPRINPISGFLSNFPKLTDKLKELYMTASK